MKRAVFPGTFDPFTNGHLDIVNKGLRMFDEIIIAIGVNAAKKEMFPFEQRIQWIKDVFKGNDKVKIASYSGLTIEFCKKESATFILRGLRSIMDFEYERQIAHVNEQLHPEIQSVFVISEQQYTVISSTIVRDLIRHGGDFKQYLPSEVRVETALP